MQCRTECTCNHPEYMGEIEHSGRDAISPVREERVTEANDVPQVVCGFLPEQPRLSALSLDVGMRAEEWLESPRLRRDDAAVTEARGQGEHEHTPDTTASSAQRQDF